MTSQLWEMANHADVFQISYTKTPLMCTETWTDVPICDKNPIEIRPAYFPLSSQRRWCWYWIKKPCQLKDFLAKYICTQSTEIKSLLPSYARWYQTSWPILRHVTAGSQGAKPLLKLMLPLGELDPQGKIFRDIWMRKYTHWVSLSLQDKMSLCHEFSCSTTIFRN